jgi:peptidoglycan/xylan/chitin deacetylase (PgdA/CDA1 family)
VRSTEFVSDLPDEEWDLQDSSDRDWAHQAIVSHAERNGLSAAEKDDLARRVADVVEVDYDDLGDRRILRLMNPDEVASLARSGIDFQLHTHRHRTPLDEALFTREIDDNRRSLQEMTGQAASHFCYPSGVHDAAFFPWLKQSGVVSATTCDTGIASRDTDPLLLPRVIDTMNLSPIEFEGWISGAGAFLPLRPHHPTHG